MTPMHIKRRAVLVAGLGATLTGCGFQPVYMKTGDGTAPAEGLAEIEVKPIYDRPGQILRQALLGQLRIEPGGPRKFDLDVGFSISGEDEGITSFTQPTYIRLVGNANWTLSGRDAKHTKLAQGSDRIIDGLDIIDSQYFAQDLDTEKTQRKIAEAMAERIALRLAMWFHQHPSATG
jgi:LPS-assembly lipoprotein